jgi:hypothetical protein
VETDPLLTVEGFTARFAESIQVCLNWDPFHAERWAIDRVEITGVEQLGMVEAPLCVDARGLPCGLDDAVRRVTLEVPGRFDHLGDRPELMHRYAGECSAAGIAADHLPAYDVGDPRVLLLDGSHRGVGALLAGVPIAIDLYVIRGTVDPDCLPDLVVT